VFGIRAIILDSGLLDSWLKWLNLAWLQHQIRFGRFFGIDKQLDMAMIAEGTGDAEEDSIDAKGSCSRVRTEPLVFKEGFAQPVEGNESV